MEEFMLNDDVFEQIKDFDQWNLTNEQSLLIDKLILNEKLKVMYKQNGLCKEYITSDFLKEIEMHNAFFSEYIDNITWCYGVTKDPESGNFMIVMAYAKDDPLKRPKANELRGLLNKLYEKLDNDESEIKKQIKEAEKINEKLTSSSTGPTLSYTTNPQAVYTSRLLDFKNLPEPKNAIDNKDDDNSFGEYSESLEALDFTELDLE
ncbi:uncharacterized protein OCT59_002315 [Rhizophagus irregularis]|uniref:uncharacterized protein n=1 Tax=Rhizophagus irregularis TaxID=588596 RepID=UPI00331D820F|nr:hypothetical protein OCT59_002315 [Rhizophagus irregularis]